MFKRHAPLIGYFLLAQVLGCSDPVIIGTACSSASSCGGKHPLCVAGLNSTPKICTHTCVNNADCPFGFDCALSDQAQKTCNKTLYKTDAKTGDPLLFGKPCGNDDSLCADTGDPNLNPMCRKATSPSETTAVPLAMDPAAY